MVPSRLLISLAAAALLGTACTTAATPSPAPPTGTAAATATTGASQSAAPTGSVAPTGSAAPSVVATVPADELEFPGKLVVCSDMPYPPQEYFDANGNPIGSDIEIAQGIAARLGLTAQVVNSVFDTIIPALTGHKCDLIASAMNINPDRLAQIDMIPYFQAGQAFMVQAGNPANIQTTEDLCGKKIAVESGTTMLDYLSGTGTFSSSGSLPAACTAASKPAPQPQPFPKDSDAVAALQAGTVDAYMADLPVVIGYADASPQSFALAPVPQIAPALEGLNVAKSADATQAHTKLYDGVKAALLAMMSDGSYLNILKKYEVDGGAITPDIVNGPLPSPAAPTASPT